MGAGKGSIYDYLAARRKPDRKSDLFVVFLLLTDQSVHHLELYQNKGNCWKLSGKGRSWGFDNSSDGI
jgi:hypothetical protein